MNAWYNEIEPYAIRWIERLAEAGHVASGPVEQRSIVDLRSGDVPGDRQCHFFAGIGGWSRALRLAGWPDDLPVWTGSCPCQPFSTAGRGLGFADVRHLWPLWSDLIDRHRPAIVFGEQVANAAGLAWLDSVSSDLEDAGYAVGAADLCAAGVGAPHMRQRLYFVGVDMADASGQRFDGINLRSRGREVLLEVARRRETGRSAVVVGDAGRSRGGRDAGADARAEAQGDRERVVAGGVGDEPEPASATRGFWKPADWIACRDGKCRPVEPGSFPLAHGVPARVGRLRGYGNAIVPELGAAFIEAAIDWVSM